MNTDTHPRDSAAPPPGTAPGAGQGPGHVTPGTSPQKAPYAGLVAATPARDADLEIRGVRAHVRVYGDPAAPHRIVFLHGLRGDHHGLEPIVAHLVRRRPDVQVYVPDLPGFGGSAPLRDAVHDIPGYAAWTADLLTALVPDGSAVLAGHSFGSIVAAATVAASTPDAPALRGLVL
ncbi:alpha/beta fold hydrolase, partial [Promicromonospora kroppenstedtii]|uniref:alpha/beta fold hydrolase n=1 Tax=Promicromonospora kroppenstedtii TaxID=440482 RepID=UPI00146F9544